MTLKLIAVNFFFTNYRILLFGLLLSAYLASVTLGVTTSSLGYNQTDQTLKYNRSSLHLVLIETESFPKKDVVMDSWDNYPFPDKYDDHRIDINKFDPSKIDLSYAEIQGAGLNAKKNEIERFIEKETAEIIDPDDKFIPLKIEKFTEQTDLARYLVAKWFNLSDDGKFDMSLVEERGYYNATEMEAAIAKASILGMPSLADAGEELISNTFIAFSKPLFLPNEVFVRPAYEKALYECGRRNNRIARKICQKAAEKSFKRAKEGYSVWTKTWLYKLKWDETISNTFYQTMWTNLNEFQKSDIFTIEYVGSQDSRSLVTFSFENRTESEIIDLATVRNIDKTFAKLQKEFDIFKPKVPVYNDRPLTAQIGKKEGLEGGERFEVLEIYLDPDSKRTKYEVVDKVRVEKEMIWDNRYKAGFLELAGALKATHFNNSDKAEIGMILRQIK